MLAKTYLNSPWLNTLAILSGWKNILTSWKPRKYVITTEYPQKTKLWRQLQPFELRFLWPYIKSDIIFVEMTSPVNISDAIKACFDIINSGGNHASNVKWHQNPKNDTCAASIPCQKDVNQRIFLCDRIEIRIRAVISDENDTIIRKMLIFGRMWLLKNTIYMT